MDLECIILTVVGGLVILGVDIVYICIQFTEWIKKHGLIKDFPLWKGTIKPLLWWIIWSCITISNVIIFAIFSLSVGTNEGIYTAYFGVIPLHTGSVALLYVCIKNAMKGKRNKS